MGLLLTGSSLKETVLFPHRKLVSAWAGQPPVSVQTSVNLHSLCPVPVVTPHPSKGSSHLEHTLPPCTFPSVCLSTTGCGRGSSLQICLMLQTHFQSHLQMSQTFALGDTVRLL